MIAYVSADGDSIGSLVGRSAMADDDEKVNRVSDMIESGNELIRAWVLSCGGKVISIGGDEQKFIIPTEHIGDIEDVREKYAEVVGATLSVGVGMKLSEAQKALLAAKLMGKDRTILYNPELEQLLAQHSAPESEQQKIQKEYLGKAFASDGVAHGGFTVATKRHADSAGPPAKPQAPAGPAPEHSQGEAAIDAAQQAKDTAYEPETTHAAEDFENSLHGLAQEQHKKDAHAQQAQVDPVEAMKQKVAQILVAVRDQAPQMEQLKQGAPDLYQAMQGVVAALVELARGLMGPDQGGDQSEPQPEGQGDEAPPEAQEAAPTQKSESEEKEDRTEAPPGFPKDVLEELVAKHGAATAMKLAWATHDKVGELEKAGLPMPKAVSTRQHLNLPAGSLHDGKLKIQHSDGSVSWVGVRSGLIQAPDGSPTSSKRPHGTG